MEGIIIAVITAAGSIAAVIITINGTTYATNGVLALNDED